MILVIFLLILAVLITATLYKFYKYWSDTKEDYIIELPSGDNNSFRQSNDETQLIDQFIRFITYLNKQGRLTSEDLDNLTRRFRESIKILKERNISPNMDSDSFLDVLLNMLNNEKDEHTLNTFAKVIEAFRSIRNFQDYDYENYD